jgi:hypothetical protein
VINLKPSLDLKDHSKDLVFENQPQAIRLLMRARSFWSAEAYSHVHVLAVRRLIRYQKMKVEDLQPRLEFVLAEAR